MKRSLAVVLTGAVLLVLTGCQGNQKTDDANTGGGGIGSHQDHKDTAQKTALNTGQSAGGGGVGRVPGSGTIDPGNDGSPSESNGGTGGSPPPVQSASTSSPQPGTGSASSR